MAGAQAYYDDSSQHGNYQYISLDEIINTVVLETQNDDSLLKNVKRSTILAHAKRGVKELNKHTANDILAVEITVGDDLKVVLPQDYVNYVRVSLVTDDYKLVPLNINYNINVAQGYLQDHDYNLLFDNEGCVLTADASNAYNKPFKIFEFDNCEIPIGHTTSYNNAGAAWRTDTSKISRHGEFVIDERRGAIVFSSNLSGREIVLEYVSDGLQWQNIDSGDITVHKYISEALIAWIEYHCIRNKRHVTRYDKRDKLREYKTLLHQAKMQRAGVNMIEVEKALRSKSKWL
ncbi:MAG: hypothetical protein ACWA5P_01995 [bacterium]